MDTKNGKMRIDRIPIRTTHLHCCAISYLYTGSHFPREELRRGTNEHRWLLPSTKDRPTNTLYEHINVIGILLFLLFLIIFVSLRSPPFFLLPFYNSSPIAGASIEFLVGQSATQMSMDGVHGSPFLRPHPWPVGGAPRRGRRRDRSSESPHCCLSPSHIILIHITFQLNSRQHIIALIPTTSRSRS